MPMKGFLYHGQVVGVDGQITAPVTHAIDGHARCGLPDRKAGHYQGQHAGHAIAGILSHGACNTEVHAMQPDGHGFYRTEVRATVENVKVLGDFPLAADRITMGLVSVYHPDWYDRRGPYAGRARVAPSGCDFGSLTVNGRPANEWLPAPFRYPAEKVEAYLQASDPDPAIEAEIQKAIAESASRFVVIPNFGRIYFGEWTIVESGGAPHVHRLSMLRLQMGSPVKGHMTFASGEDDGAPDPPKP